MIDSPPSGAQQAAEADVESHHRDLGPFVVATDETRMPMVFTNALEQRHPIIYANDAFLKLTGYARQSLLGTPLADLLGKDTPESVRQEFASAFNGADVDPEFACRTCGGSEVWVSLHVSPVRDGDGKIIQHFASLVDLTRHVSAQRQARLLVDELNHRVRNNLAILQSITRLASKRLRSPMELGRAIEDRIVAISHAQHLLEGAHWSTMPLRRVIEAAVHSIVPPARSTIEGPEISLTAPQSWTLSLALHELLLTARSRMTVVDGSSRLRVRWERTAASSALIHWDELGRPTTEPSPDNDLGKLLMERQVGHELAGRITATADDDGFHYTIEIPIQAP